VLKSPASIPDEISVRIERQQQVLIPSPDRKEGEREGNDATRASSQMADNIRQPVSNKVRSYRLNLPEPCQ